MLITQLKAKEAITSLTAGKKVFIINCHGCKEVHFPEKEAVELQKELSAEGNVTGIMTTDYICNPENMELRLQKHMSKIQEADLVLVFSCGVGVQTISEYLEDKMVCAACDTYPGCKEVHFPEKEAVELQKELSAEGNVTGIMTTDYICNPENMELRLQKHMSKIQEADLVLVFSCGVGVQTISEYLEDKMVCAACDTYPVPGFQGVTPLEYKCDQCGECYLNLTGGICPITACSKSLVNGQCGGSKNGKCEVDSEMECGWERIYRRLKEIGRLDVLKCPTQIHNFATDDEVK